MKILLINYHFFIHGGPDRYFFNIKSALENEGHTIIPFSFNYEDTLDTPYKKYFPNPITGKGPFLLSKISMNLLGKFKAIFRMFFNSEVNKKFRALMDKEKPDVVFSVYLSSSMLPNILKIAKVEYGVKVIYRLSDFHIYCASLLFHRKDKNICTDCLSNKWSAVKYKCVKDSTLASTLRVLQMKNIRYNNWYDSVDTFICPSKTMAQYIISGGIPSEKVKHIPTFTKDIGNQPTQNKKARPYVLYFGIIRPEKGSEILIKAFNKLKNPNFKLIMVGYVEPSYRKLLIDIIDKEHMELVDILLPQQGSELVDTIKNSLFVVHPALCLENMPNSVLEAMSAGKPIITSNLGSLPELVQDGVNGRLVEPGNVTAIAKSIELLSMSPDQIKIMGENSRLLFEQKYTETVHIEKLKEVIG